MNGSKSIAVAATLALISACAWYALNTSPAPTSGILLRARTLFSNAPGESFATTDFLVPVPTSELRRLEPLVGAGEVEILFTSERGEIWLKAARPAVLTEKLGISPRVMVRDSLGALQAISENQNAGSFEAEIDFGWSPSLETALQWYRFSWPTALVGKFPFTVDQRLSSVRTKHTDEVRYWNRSNDTVSSQDVRTCVNHFPATMRHQEAGFIFPESEFPVQVWLQDAPPDLSHPTFANVGRPGLKDKVIETPDSHASLMVSVLANAAGLGLDEQFLKGSVRKKLRKKGGAKFPLVTLRAIPLPLDKGALRMSDAVKGLGKIADALELSAGTAVVLLGYGFQLPQEANEPGQPLRDAIDRLLALNAVVVAPAGNTSDSRLFDGISALAPSRFAALPHIFEGKTGRLLGVSALDLCSRRAWFSREARTRAGAAYYAPGERIYGAFPQNDYGFLSGTSFAAAQLAGLLVRALSVQPATPATLEKWVERSSRELPAVHDRAYLIDAVKMALLLENLNKP